MKIYTTLNIVRESLRGSELWDKLVARLGQDHNANSSFDLAVILEIGTVPDVLRLLNRTIQSTMFFTMVLVFSFIEANIADANVEADVKQRWREILQKLRKMATYNNMPAFNASEILSSDPGSKASDAERNMEETLRLVTEGLFSLKRCEEKDFKASATLFLSARNNFTKAALMAYNFPGSDELWQRKDDIVRKALEIDDAVVYKDIASTISATEATGNLPEIHVQLERIKGLVTCAETEGTINEGLLNDHLRRIRHAAAQFNTDQLVKIAQQNKTA